MVSGSVLSSGVLEELLGSEPQWPISETITCNACDVIWRAVQVENSTNVKAFHKD